MTSGTRRHDSQETATPADAPLSRAGGRSIWSARVLPGFVMLALLALAVIPVLLDTRIEPYRETIWEVAEPATAVAGDIQFSLARKMTALRGYLVTGEPRFLDRYEQVHAEEQTLLPRLDSLAGRLGPDVTRRAEVLRSEIDRWNAWVEESGIRSRGWASIEYFERIPFEQSMYDAALDASLRLEGTIRAIQAELRNEIASLERIGTRISRALVVLALIAMGGVAWVGRRMRSLNDDLDQWARREASLREEADRSRAEALRRARNEEALREAAEAVSAAYTMEEVGQRIADSAVAAGLADGATVELVDPTTGARETVASAGLVDRAEEPGRPAAPEAWHALTPGQEGDRPAVSIPLGAPPDPVGALVLVRDPSRRIFEQKDLDRARIFGELATLAARKVHLLETAELRRAELEKVTRSRSRLIRGFSHDLKNPLGAADAHASLLASGIRGPLTDEQHESIARIRDTLASAFDLIDELVELGRVEAGQLRIHPQPVDVCRTATEVAAEYRAQADAAGLSLRVETLDRVPHVRTDPQRLRQVLGNLLSNAVKYTSSGEIRVRLRWCADLARGENREWVFIDVCDTGPGIPEEKQTMLFKEFSRLHISGVSGAGLGLAISARIVEALGGEISVESTPGAGSTFTVALPVRGGDAEADVP